MNNSRYQRLWLWLVWVAFAIVILKGGYDLYWRLWYEWHGAYNGDSVIYWAVGRGLVNGLTLYVDLFDIKPPMMFLISAFSYLVGDSMRVGHLLQGLVIIGTILVVWAPCATYMRGARTDVWKALMMLLCTASAVALGLYTGTRSGEFQTESFGAFFGCCFIAIVAWNRMNPGWKAGVFCGIFLGLSVMTKEPFILTCVAGSLFLIRSRREFLWLVIVPGVVAALFSVVLLLSLGALYTYVTIYLDYMVNSRVQRFGPPWIRGLLVVRTWTELRSYTVMFALLLPTAVCTWYGIRLTRWSASLLRSWVGSICILGSFASVILILSLVPLDSLHAGWFSFPIAACLIGLEVLRRSVWSKKEWGVVGWHVCLWIGSVYAVTYAAGLSGEFLGHHFVFAVPIYAGLLLACVQELSSREDQWSRGALVLLAILAAGSVVMPATINAHEKIEAVHAFEAQHRLRILAREMDAILTACKEDRYLIVGEPGTDIFAFTQHYPLGPGFFQHTVNMTEGYFFKGFVKNIQTADVIVYRRGFGRGHPAKIQRYIDLAFTYEPWACAVPHLNEGKYIFLFRQDL